MSIFCKLAKSLVTIWRKFLMISSSQSVSVIRFVGVLTLGFNPSFIFYWPPLFCNTKQGRSIKDFYINSNGFSISIECRNAINRKLPDGRGLTFESNDNFMLICCTLPAGGRGVSVSVRGLQCIVTTDDAGAAWAMMYSCTQVSTHPSCVISSARCVTVEPVL